MKLNWFYPGKNCKDCFYYLNKARGNDGTFECYNGPHAIYILEDGETKFRVCSNHDYSGMDKLYKKFTSECSE